VALCKSPALRKRRRGTTRRSPLFHRVSPTLVFVSDRCFWVRPLLLHSTVALVNAD